MLKESVISNRMPLWEEWNRKELFQTLSLILKSLAMIKILWIFTLVSLRYFKVDWWLLE